MIDAEDFVIPEIQRPFVWKRSQVRDLIDSLYNGYPTGYIITWKNPDVKTKDGGKANGKKVLIDGQQRVTALMAAIAGKEVLDEDFNKDRIKIAFNPLAEDETKHFAVQDASHIKDKRWIPDISVVFSPDFYAQLTHDSEFQASKYADKIKWRAKDYDDIYAPDYGDMLRVSFMHQFRRGKLADLVSLLSGRDFVTKEFREDIVEESYAKLDAGIMNFINQYNFSQFVMAIKGAGYVSSKLLNSRMTLDFAYTLYLMLLDDTAIPNAQIKRYVQKWFVLSTLTSRYIGSPETQMDHDMRIIGEKGFVTFLEDVEASVLSETFWTVTLPQNLETSSVNSPAFNTFLTAQINMNCNSMLMNGTNVADLITISGDVHHIFPRSYLKNNGVRL